MTLKELEYKYADKIITTDELYEIIENEFIGDVEDNGYSGFNVNCKWYTVYNLNNEELFDIYIKI